MPDGFVQLATLTTLVPPLTDVDFHVFLQQVTSQKLLVAQCALKGLVACIQRKETQRKKLNIYQWTNKRSIKVDQKVL